LLAALILESNAPTSQDEERQEKTTMNENQTPHEQNQDPEPSPSPDPIDTKYRPRRSQYGRAAQRGRDKNRDTKRRIINQHSF
jgi:hypothetical protein